MTDLGDDSGFVSREVVIAVLEGSGVRVTKNREAGENWYMIHPSTGREIPQVVEINEQNHRRVCLAFAHRYKIPAHYFWHPERVGKPAGEWCLNLRDFADFKGGFRGLPIRVIRSSPRYNTL